MKIVFVLGTRPEAIKLAPVIRECKLRQGIEVVVCSTGQHRQMLDQVLKTFDIAPDIELAVMTKNQSLIDVTAITLAALGKELSEHAPDLVVVQGDTTTAFVGALCASYQHIPVLHVEAGLRTWDRENPFPEEINRSLIDQIADYCMAPTSSAEKNLIASGIESDRIWITGNTAVDAILIAASSVSAVAAPGALPKAFIDSIENGDRAIVVTGHRRESFGEDFEAICGAIKHIAEQNHEVQIIYPVHMNPNVQLPVHRILGNTANIHLIPPLEYPAFVWLLKKAYLVLTDSGGIQEEVPSLDIPVLVMRNVTERPEGIAAGCAKLVGVSTSRIVREVAKLLDDTELHAQMSSVANPYGDGEASKHIADVIEGISTKND